MWTNTSLPTSSGTMKPYFSATLNHLTVPVAMNFPSLAAARDARTNRRERAIAERPLDKARESLDGFEMGDSADPGPSGPVGRSTGARAASTPPCEVVNAGTPHRTPRRARRAPTDRRVALRPGSEGRRGAAC